MSEIDYGHQMNPWARPQYDKDSDREDENKRLISQHLRHIDYAARHLKRRGSE